MAVGNREQAEPAGRTVAGRPTEGVLAVRTTAQDTQHVNNVNIGSRRDLTGCQSYDDLFQGHFVYHVPTEHRSGSHLGSYTTALK